MLYVYMQELYYDLCNCEVDVQVMNFRFHIVGVRFISHLTWRS